MTVRVVTDGAAALPRDLQERLDIGVVPMTVSIGGVAVDESELTVDDLATAADVTTSGPTPGAFARTISEVADCDGVLVLTVAASLSSSHQSAMLGAETVQIEGGPPVRVVDTRNAAGGQALVVRAAAETAAEGGSLDETAARALDVASQVRLVGALDGLEQLVRSGRIPALAGRTGDRLGMRPLFEIDRGQIRRLLPAHSVAAAERRMLKLWRTTQPPVGALHVVALHAATPERARRLLDAVSREVEPASSFVSGFGPAMIVNSGPGVFGLAWWWETGQG